MKFYSLVYDRNFFMNFGKTHNLYQKDLKEVARLCLKDVGWAQRAQTSAKVSNLNQK